MCDEVERRIETEHVVVVPHADLGKPLWIMCEIDELGFRPGRPDTDGVTWSHWTEDTINKTERPWDAPVHVINSFDKILIVRARHCRRDAGNSRLTDGHMICSSHSLGLGLSSWFLVLPVVRIVASRVEALRWPGFILVGPMTLRILVVQIVLSAFLIVPSPKVPLPFWHGDAAVVFGMARVLPKAARLAFPGLDFPAVWSVAQLKSGESICVCGTGEWLASRHAVRTKTFDNVMLDKGSRRFRVSQYLA